VGYFACGVGESEASLLALRETARPGAQQSENKAMAIQALIAALNIRTY